MSGEVRETSGPRYKVERVIDRYGLEGLAKELERQWLGKDREERSLRDLAEEVNLEILRSALEDAGQVVIDSEVEATYEVLAGDQASSADRSKIRRDLERHGIDVDRLESDFVTHQAVYTYLTKGRGVSKEAARGDPVVNSTETINRLKSRTAVVTESELERLVSRSAITLGDFDVIVSITVVCQDCGTQRDVTSLLDDGGCDCQD